MDILNGALAFLYGVARFLVDNAGQHAIGVVFVIIGIAISGREFGTHGARSGDQGGKPMGWSIALLSTVISMSMFVLFCLLPGWWRVIPGVIYIAWLIVFQRSLPADQSKGYLALVIDDGMHIAPIVLGLALIFNVIDTVQMGQLILKAITQTSPSELPTLPTQ
jgi:hypothetical protein